MPWQRGLIFFPARVLTFGKQQMSTPPSPPRIHQKKKKKIVRSCHPIRNKKERTRCGSPPRYKWFLVGCSSLFVRLAEHLAALRAWCTRRLPGRRKPDVLRIIPTLQGFEGLMVPLWSHHYGHTTTAVRDMDTPPPPPPPPAPLRIHRLSAALDASNVCLVGDNPTWLVPALQGCEGLQSYSRA